MDELQEIIREIDREKKKLDELLPLKPVQQQALDQKLRLEWNFHSNHIEGSTLTYGQTKLLLFFDQTSGDHPVRDIEEMKAHDTAVAFVRREALDTERSLTAQFLRELNEIILVRPFYKEAVTPDGQETRKLITPGQYKTTPNSVRLANGTLFEYASPEETPAKVAELIERYHNDWEAYHPIVKAASFHYRFVRIHPFDDGNGRVARLIMNYILLENGYPPIIIRTEDNKNYLLALRRADAGDLDAFILYIANQLPYTLDFYFRAAREESLEDVGDFEKRLALLNRSLETSAVSRKFKTKDILYQLAEGFIANFLIELENKHKEIAQLFQDSEASYKLNEDEFRANLARTLIARISTVVKGSVIDGEIKKERKGFEALLSREQEIIITSIHRIDFRFSIRYLKRGNSPNISFARKGAIIFHDDHYIYTSNGQVVGKYYYSKLFFTSEEIALLAEGFWSPVLQQIEDHLQKNGH
ncbi:MAG: Fic family protein [Bacteroidota bacterium]